MRRDITTIIAGLLFLLAGISVGGSMLGFFDFDFSFDGWWTLFLIVPALLTIVQGGFNAGNMILLSIGVVLLLDAQNVLPRNFSWRLVFPLVLLAVGFQLVFGGRSGRRGSWNDHSPDSRGKEQNAGNRPSGTPGAASAGMGSGGTESTRGGTSYKSASAIFGGQDIVYGPEDYSGGTYSAIFGGMTVNLRSVTLVGDVVITVTAMFGGIEFILPDNVMVVSNVLPILGGVECKYASSRDPLAPKIIINGNASFGGIEIK